MRVPMKLNIYPEQEWLLCAGYENCRLNKVIFELEARVKAGWIAQRLNISKNTVKVHLTRALNASKLSKYHTDSRL